MSHHAYLDWNATAPIEPVAIEAMAAAARAWANPASVHRPGRRARAAVEDARERIARCLGCSPGAVVFTSGGTEALGLALRGAAAASRVVSAVEHDAVLRQAEDAHIAPVDATGRIDLARLERLLATLPQPALVAVMHVNNETGVVQPVREVLALVHAAGGRLLCDAVQSAGKLELPAADFAAVSAHKLGGPPGVGALIVRCSESIAAVQRGGGQERGLRAGTENLPGIAGFAAAVEARADRTWLARTGELRTALEKRLVAAGAQVVAADTERIATTSCIRMPGVSAATQLMHFDLAGMAVSSGAACASGKVGASHVLRAMGLDPAAAGEAIRISFGWTTSAEEVASFASAWEALAQRRRVA